MDPIPKMVIRTQLARRKGELEVSSVEEISELVDQLMIARTALITAQAAIEGVLKARADMAAEPEPELEAAAAPTDPAAIPTADGQHVTCPACGFRDSRHNPAGCKRLEQLERIGEQVTRLSEPEPERRPMCDCLTEPEPASPEAVDALLDSIVAGTPLLVTDDEPRCECSHHMNDHDEDGAHECHFPGCGCIRWRRATAKGQAEPPRVVAGTVEPTGLQKPRPVLRVLTADEADEAESITYLACGDQSANHGYGLLAVGAVAWCPNHGNTEVISAADYMDRAVSS